MLAVELVHVSFGSDHSCQIVKAANSFVCHPATMFVPSVSGKQINSHFTYCYERAAHCCERRALCCERAAPSCGHVRTHSPCAVFSPLLAPLSRPDMQSANLLRWILKSRRLWHSGPFRHRASSSLRSKRVILWLPRASSLPGSLPAHAFRPRVTLPMRAWYLA